MLLLSALLPHPFRAPPYPLLLGRYEEELEKRKTETTYEVLAGGKSAELDKDKFVAVDEWVRRQQVEYPDLSRLGYGIGRDYYHQRFEHYEGVRGMRKQYLLGGLFVLGVFSCDYIIELFINGQVSARKSAVCASLCLHSAMATLFALPLVLPVALTQRLARAGGNA